MRLLIAILISLPLVCFSQSKKERIPSYFGFQVSPVFPTAFIGSPTLQLSGQGFETTLTQKMGYRFGATVRAGITKLIAFDTGINYTQRNFALDMAMPDSNSYAKDTMTFIEYDIPMNALVYIQLSEKWFMNTSLGMALTFKPTDIQVYNKPGGYHYYHHVGIVQKKIWFDFNASVGFEFRTEKDGFFYLGGTARVPFSPLFVLLADHSYQGNSIQLYGNVDGSFLSIDFKYFFPNIKNKGTQFNKGPIE